MNDKKEERKEQYPASPQENESLAAPDQTPPIDEEESLALLNELVPADERPVLDAYIDLLIEGESDAFGVLATRASTPPSKLAEFLNHSLRRQYVSGKLAYFLQCAEIDRIRTLKETRDLAFSNPHSMFRPVTRSFYDRHTGKTETAETFELKPFSDIPKTMWKSIRQIKFDNFGRPTIAFHSKLEALKLMTKLQDLAKRPSITDPSKQNKGLFHLNHAEIAPTPPSNKEDDLVIDAEFTSADASTLAKIKATPTRVQNLSPEVTKADIEQYSPEAMYNASEEF